MSTPTPWDSLRDLPAIQWLRERDIDLLICSELRLDGGPLQELLVGRWNGGAARLQGAWISHWDGNDETDIVALFRSGERTLALLIENKIDAEFQPAQPERYRNRAQRWRESSGPGWDVETVLLAPSGYFGHEGSEVFDRQLSYENVIQVLSQSQDQRTVFLANALQKGIESHRRGYLWEVDEVRTEVWRAFWEIATQETPRLRMRRPDEKPGRAGFINFWDADGVSSTETAGGVNIVYKFRNSPREPHCCVDIQFRSMREGALRAGVEGLLEPGMRVVQAGQSASIRVEVPFVDFDRMPGGQEDSIKEGLFAAERLRVFFIEKGLGKLVVPG